MLMKSLQTPCHENPVLESVRPVCRTCQHPTAPRAVPQRRPAVASPTNASRIAQSAVDPLLAPGCAALGVFAGGIARGRFVRAAILPAPERGGVSAQSRTHHRSQL